MFMRSICGSLGTKRRQPLSHACVCLRSVRMCGCVIGCTFVCDCATVCNWLSITVTLMRNQGKLQIDCLQYSLAEYAL